MNRSWTWAAATLCAASTVGCTAGFITNQDGSQWTPANPAGAGVVTISGGGTSYQVWTDQAQSDTFFSFDPTTSERTSGNYVVNNDVVIPQGTYNFTVSDGRVWNAYGVSVNNTNACPFTDYWTGDNTDCQLFQLELLNCGVKPVPPYVSGNSTVVQLARTDSACQFTCTAHNVKDVAGAFFINPQIEEVYWGCPPGAPGGCAASPSTGVWAALSSSTPFWSRMVEYGTGSGAYGGAYSDTPSGVTTYVTDAQIKTALLAELASGKIKTIPNMANPAIFVIYLPTTSCTSLDGRTCNTAEGAHHWFFENNGEGYTFAVIDGSTSASFLDAAATHEVAEAATDFNDYGPGCGTNTGCGWNEPNTNEGEIADLCGNNETIAGHTVAQVWSQSSCTCL